jgi:hypothetical protein
MWRKRICLEKVKNHVESAHYIRETKQKSIDSANHSTQPGYHYLGMLS